MTQKDFNNESIRTLCKMNRSIFYAIREEADLRLKNYFYYSKNRIFDVLYNKNTQKNMCIFTKTTVNSSPAYIL